MNPVDVRIATEEDVRFVASTWFRSVLESGATLNSIPFAIVRDGLDAHIKNSLAKSITRVAFATATPDEILGYCVLGSASDPRQNVRGQIVCHHIYTKALYRKQGVARSLLGDVKTYTNPATNGAGKKFALALGLSYNPRLA